ncbi:two-component regulator propeller domain-containing protein [Bacteroides sp.]|uniref:hybrid sensor histidine kinase/response regulator transcription factor n=1 Tax=Bacteroides sp. TaxID=29523 RepID=UPI0025C67FCE|nr:two-component regulator propeller domain-containing protein [Bacteroides sp.]
MKNIVINRKFWLICFSLWWSFLSITALGNDYSFRTLTVMDGLSNNSVKAIYQDSLGFIWMGTKNGLNRFDGYESKTYYNHNEEFVGQSNDVINITPDKAGNMWIGTFNGVMLFNPYTGKFKDLSQAYQGELPRGVVVNIWMERDSAVWVATKSGLYFLRGNTSSCVEAFRGKYINAMAASGEHTLLIDIVQQGLIEFDIKNNVITPFKDKEERPVFSKIMRDTKRRIWCAADLGNIFIADSSGYTLKRVDTSGLKIGFKQAQVHDLLEYNDSTLLLATDNGLYALDMSDFLKVHPVSDIFPTELTKVNRQMCLFKDRQESLWIGTFNEGAMLFNSQYTKFRSYLFHSDIRREPLRVVGKLVEYRQQIWVGCNTGIFVIDLISGQWYRVNLDNQLEIDTNSEIYYVYQLSENQILFYLLNQGTFVLNLDTKKVSRYDIGTSASSQIRSIARDMDGKLWIAQDELSLFDVVLRKGSVDLSTNYDGTTRFMFTQDILPVGRDMLVGTRTRGVWRFQRNLDDELKYFKGEPWGGKELENKNVSVLYEDSERNIWVGTYDSGLYMYDSKSNEVIHFFGQDKIAHNTIYDIIQDKQTGMIWVATLMGISRITKDQQVLNYTYKNGFPIHELSGHSFLEASNGNIFVGGRGGVVELLLSELYNTSGIALQPRISQVETLNSITGSNHLLFDNSEAFKEIELNYGNSSVQIKFSAMDYLFPDGVKYAYRLKGVEKEWNYVNRNEAIYSNLPAGIYTFQVKVCSSDGVWGDAITSLPLVVNPPVWLSVWAKMLYFLLVLFMIYLILRYYYMKKTAKYRLKIEEIKKENIERDYKMKIELFTNFSHELRTPLTLIKGPAEDILYDEALPRKFVYSVKQILKNSNRLLLLVNQLMDFRKIEHGAMQLNLSNVNMVSFMTERIDSFSELLQKRGIVIRYTNDYYGSNWWIDADLMEKVIFNLLSNAIKHSKDDSVIKVVSSVEGDKLILSVQDYGEGISQENINKIFDPFFQVKQGSMSNMFGSGIGLNLAKYVVSLHHGKIWAESVVGQGTTFFIELQLGKEQYTKDDVVYAEGDSVDKTFALEKESLKPISEPLWEDTNSNETDEAPVVLVAEDDEDLRKYLVLQLSASYKVIEAANGRVALELALEKFPDIILSDVMMPEMNGLEFCEQVKSNPKLAHIPFVMLTAKVLDEHIKEGYSVLADDYILKPFNITVLKAKIESIIKNREQLRRLFGEKMSAIEVPMPEIAAVDPFMDKLIELIKEKAADSELQVSDLYEEMGYGRIQFFRKIKAVSGISPNKLIVNIRMKMAADMLRENKYTISEIAYQTGFSDPSYFSRVFKSVFQITPKEYQKNMK